MRNIFNFKVGIICIDLLLLLTGCESKPVKFTPPGSNQLVRQIFMMSDSSSTRQDSVLIGKSPRLYAGWLNDTTKSVILLGISDSSLKSHPICSDSIEALNIQPPEIRIYSVNLLANVIDDEISEVFLDTTTLKAHLIEQGEWSEDSDLLDADIQAIRSSVGTPLNVSINNNELSIIFTDSEIHVSDWCNDDSKFIRISYGKPENADYWSYLEFYASEYSTTMGPHLRMQFNMQEEQENIYNQFVLNSLSSQIATDFHMVTNDSVPTWSTFYLLNIEEDESVELMDIFSLDSLHYESILISDENVNTELDIMTLIISLNEKIIDSINTFTFQITDVVAMRANSDPSEDNSDGTDSTLTENNLTYDVGEFYMDLGVDNCADEFEDGNGGCHSVEGEGPFNALGSENNGILDEGETWDDCGIDGLCDGEVGDNDSDNYNIDPAGDDYSAENLSGTEDNGQWDDDEDFLDYGTDGLSDTDDSNDTEGNGSYDLGEPFFDTGIDLLYSNEEGGYNYLGTEGNDEYDEGENIHDCGIDSLCDGEEGDDESDDYNIDPNIDNSYEGNGILDWVDGGELNGIWDEGEGEQWFDWGTDQIPDSLEQFQESNLPHVSLGYNEYEISKSSSEIIQYEQPEFGENQIIFWVSSIEPLENDKFEITFSTITQIELTGFAFTLTHSPINRTELTEIAYDHSLTYIGTDNKIFKDLSVYSPIEPIENMNDSLGAIEIDFAMGMESILEFSELGSFIKDNSNTLIMNQNTYLTLSVDTATTQIHEFGSFIVLHGIISNEIVQLGSTQVLDEDIAIKFPLGNIIQKYVNGQYEHYDGFSLSLSGSLNNFSHLTINKNGSYIEVLHSR